MKRKRVKRKIKVGRLLIAILILVIIGLLIFFLTKKSSDIIIHKKNMYLASDNNEVVLYSYDENNNLKEDKKVVRGKKVTCYDNVIDEDDTKYNKIKYEDNVYYVNSGNLVSDANEVVLESSRFIRTSSTVYENDKDTKISSFIKKGNEVSIVGYDYLNDDGSVNMYKIEKDDISGYVYAKYLVSSSDEANINYNENSVYDTHKDRKYPGRELHGGSAATLDYYPYEKVEFKDNPLMKNAKAMYLNAATISSIDSYLKIAKENGVNTIVVDIKDGALAYSSEVAKEVSPTAYATAINDNSVYKSAIDKIKEAGIYAIGRIVVFNDVHYGKDHPEDCISSSASSRLWPSAYSRGAWEYNVNLAIEGAKEMGFNEIQFDYVRFPEDAYNMSISGNSDFKNKYDE